MNLALFDFDGTITTTDSFSAFLRFAVTRRRMILGAVLLGPVLAAYKLGLLSARRSRPLVARFAFQGKDASSVRQLGAAFARDVLPSVVRRHAVDRIQWHMTRGDLVVVVSASLDVYLSAWCEALAVDVICTELEEKGGILTGRYIGGDCCGTEKLTRIRARYDLPRYSVIYAYGDTDEDREMLEIAHEKSYRWRMISEWREAARSGTAHPGPGAH